MKVVEERIFSVVAFPKGDWRPRGGQGSAEGMAGLQALELPLPVRFPKKLEGGERSSY